MLKSAHTRRNFLRMVGLSGAGLVITHTIGHAEAQEKQLPNIIYIMDDPYETKDLWNENPKVVQKLIVLLDEYRNSGRSRPTSY